MLAGGQTWIPGRTRYGAVRLRQPVESEGPPEDLSAIDGWLAEREGQVGPNPDTGKTVIWHGKAGTRTERAIIYVHGFTGTRGETKPTADRLAHRLGANLFYTRLAGHGLDGAALGKATIEQWRDDVHEAWRIGTLIGRRVTIIAVSTGAPLACELALRTGVAAEALILGSPNFGIRQWYSHFVLRSRLLIRLFAGAEIRSDPRNQLEAAFWTLRYPIAALFTMQQAVRIGRALPLDELVTPTLVLYTPADRTVSVPAIKRTYRRLGSEMKRLVSVDVARDHVLSGEAVSPQATDFVVERILAFIGEV